jgi:lysyl-tRNA synthetase class 1
VLQVPVQVADAHAGTIVFEDEDGTRTELPVTGGHCKLQWKADWAMRWHALQVDYEMSGKDLIDSVKLSSQICRILGSAPPEGFTYELFLDEKGEKISKSRGNGLTIEEWLRYASPESLSLYMFQQPRRAKRLYFDVIPRAVDEYLTFLEKFAGEDEGKRLENPAWHIHAGEPPAETSPVSYGLLLNLAGAASAESKEVMWGFIRGHKPDVTPERHPLLDRLVGYALAYYQDFVKPAKRYRAPSAQERAALEELASWLEQADKSLSAEALQDEVYEIGKRHGFTNLRDWFKAMYEVLFGQEQGPRMGSFIALYGGRETATLIRRALAGELVAAA